jgi:tetratricopeptide (TPR) repeat protein
MRTADACSGATVGGIFVLGAGLGLVLALGACVPYRPAPVRTVRSPDVIATGPEGARVASPPIEITRRSEEPKIREEVVREKPPQQEARLKERAPSLAAPLRPRLQPQFEESLLAKITPRTPPQRAASLRLAEEGRKLMEAGDYVKALGRLERTIAIDSTNAYGYYYLAKAQYHLSRHQESLNFLDVAETLFVSDPQWLAEVFALRGANFLALGQLSRAGLSYREALRLSPDHRSAAEGMVRVQTESGGAIR